MISRILFAIGTVIISAQLLAGGRFELIAHRGGIPSVPENSLAAFEKALRSTPSIETDIHFTRDNIPVILHDRTLDRTTDCHGLLNEKTWAEVRRCRLLKPSGRLSRLHLPSLRSVLNDHALRSARMILEIKDYNPKGIDRMMRMIRNRRGIRLSSFDLKTLRYLHRRYRFPHLILVAGHIPRTIPTWIEGLFLCSGQANQTTLRALPKRLRIYLWTVNRLRELTRIRTLPIDGIITDRVQFFRGKI